MTKTSIRTFNDSDWEGFSGCTSSDPLIVEFSNPNFFLVVDGAYAEAHRLIDDDKAYYYSAEFPTPGIALIAAMSLQGNESLTQVSNAWCEFALKDTGASGAL